MQKGDLVDHQGRLVRVVSVDGDDVLVLTGGYGTTPVLVHRTSLGKKVYRPYGTGPFEGEFTSTMNDNKGLVLAVIGAGAVLTGILLFSKPAALANGSPTRYPPSPPPPQPMPVPETTPAVTPAVTPPVSTTPSSTPPPPPSTPAPSHSGPAKAPAPVPRAQPKPPRAPAAPAAPRGFNVPPPLTGSVPRGTPAPFAPLTPADIADIATARFGDLSTLGHLGTGAGIAASNANLPASVGSPVPVANIPGAGSLPASMSAAMAASAGAAAAGGSTGEDTGGGVLGMLESLNPFS